MSYRFIFFPSHGGHEIVSPENLKMIFKVGGERIPTTQYRRFPKPKNNIYETVKKINLDEPMNQTLINCLAYSSI